MEPDESPCHCLALRQAARQATQVYDRHLAAEGLRSTQYSILSKLGRLGPRSVNALAASMAMDRTTRLKAAFRHWKNAQKEFETAYGASNAAKLRGSLRQVVAALR